MTIRYYYLAVAVIFGLLSGLFLFSFYPLGSNEASLLLTKKPSIINWDKFHQHGGKEIAKIVEIDTFYHFQSSGRLKVVENVVSKPSLYIKGQDSLFPLLMQTRTGALPHWINRLLSQWTSPTISLGLFSWLCGLISFLAAFYYIQCTSGLGVPFALIASLTPQMVYFIGPSYQDFHVSLTLFFVALCALEVGQSKRIMVFVGFVLGMALYCKLAFALFLPLLIYLYPKKIKDSFRWLILGSLPFVIFLLWSLNWTDLHQILLKERTLVKGSDFHTKVAQEFLFYWFLPHKIFPYIFSDVHLAKVLNGFWDIAVFGIGLGLLIAAVFFLFSKKNKIFLGTFIFAYLFVISSIAHSFHEDLFSYLSQGIYVFSVLFLSKMDIRKAKKGWTYAFILFLLLKGVILISWNDGFSKITKEFPGCIWLYECLEKEIVSEGFTAQDKLITMNYLDVGQLEFFSKEKILPLHIYWKYGRGPEAGEFLDFLAQLPFEKTYLLQSYGNDGRDWSYYAKASEAEIISLLNKRGIEVQELRKFNYPALDRYYKLMKLTKKLSLDR